MWEVCSSAQGPQLASRKAPGQVRVSFQSWHSSHCIRLEFSVFVLGLVPSLLALIELINSFSQKHKWWIKPNMFFFFNAFLEWSLDMLILYFYCIILMLHLICYVVGNVQTGEGTKHDCIIWLSIAKPPEISQSPSLSHYPPPRDNP